MKNKIKLICPKDFINKAKENKKKNVRNGYGGILYGTSSLISFEMGDNRVEMTPLRVFERVQKAIVEVYRKGVKIAHGTAWLNSETGAVRPSLNTCNDVRYEFSEWKTMLSEAKKLVFAAFDCMAEFYAEAESQKSSGSKSKPTGNGISKNAKVVSGGEQVLKPVLLKAADPGRRKVSSDRSPIGTCSVLKESWETREHWCYPKKSAPYKRKAHSNHRHLPE